MDNEISYHKGIEYRYHQLHDDITSLFFSIPEFFRETLPTEIVQYVHLPDAIVWSEFFEDDDEDKSSIDISNPEMLEQVVSDNKDDIEKLLLGLKEVKDILERIVDGIGVNSEVADSFFEIICENLAEKGQLNLFTEEYADYSLHLTAEELYTALTLIPIESVRNLLSSLPDSSFAVLYKRYKEGNRIGFIEAFESLDIHGIANLNKYLFPYLDNVYPFYRFLLDNIDRTFPLYVDMMSDAGVPDEIIDSMDSISNINESECLTKSDIESLQDTQNGLFAPVINIKQSDSELPRRFKNKINKVSTDHSKASSCTNCGEDSSNRLHLSERTINTMREFSNQWIIEALHRIIDGDLETIAEEKSLLEKSEEGLRLQFPSRIEANKIDSTYNNQILKGLYEKYGQYIENYSGDIITENEFIYLFSGRIPRPQNYNTPYYWNTDHKIFAGLIRLLYYGQPTGFDDIILLVEDKGVNRCSKKWSSMTQGLGKKTLEPIETNIQNIILEIAGKRLNSVDLMKRNKSKKKL